MKWRQPSRQAGSPGEHESTSWTGLGLRGGRCPARRKPKKSHLPTAGHSSTRGVCRNCRRNEGQSTGGGSARVETVLGVSAPTPQSVTCGANGGKIRDTAAEKIAASGQMLTRIKIQIMYVQAQAARKLLADSLVDFGHGCALGCE